MKALKKYQLFSIIFTFLLGSLLHFTYDWSNQNPIVAVFSSINESTWEHLKLIYFPMLITTIMGYFIFKNKVPNFLCSKVIGIIVAMLFTVIFFYTYSGILGTNVAFIDIGSFFIAIIIGEVVSYLLMRNKFECNNLIALVILIILFICFIIFTYNAPRIGLFEDPTKIINCSIKEDL